MERQASRKMKWLLVLLLVPLFLANLGLSAMGGQGREVCSIDLTTGENNCRGPVRIENLSPSSSGYYQALLSLHGCGCFKIILETSNVFGNWLNLGNSPTNDGFGGDAGTFSHDSELNVHDRTLFISGNDYGHMRCPNITPYYVRVENFTASSGVVTLQVHPGFVRIESMPNHNVVTLPSCYSQEPCIFACGNGPDREHGFNDDVFWLGLNRVVLGTRTGSGVRKVTILWYPKGACCCGCDP